MQIKYFEAPAVAHEEWDQFYPLNETVWQVNTDLLNCIRGKKINILL